MAIAKDLHPAEVWAMIVILLGLTGFATFLFLASVGG